MKDITALALPIHATYNNNAPALQIKKTTSDPETIKRIIYLVLNKKPIMCYIQPTDELAFISALLKKGLISKDSKGNIQLTF